jgi:hypothetical protein
MDEEFTVGVRDFVQADFPARKEDGTELNEGWKRALPRIKDRCPRAGVGKAEETNVRACDAVPLRDPLVRP